MTEKLYSDIRDNIKEIKEKVRNAALSVGRDPEEIRIMAVTKTVKPEIVNIAIENGIMLLGENRAQEMNSKINDYNLEKAKVHFIGALQSNKVRQIIDDVDMIQSLDRMSLVKEIERQASSRNIVIDCLVQVNIGMEKTKAGIMPKNMIEFVSMLKNYKHIKVKGIMAIPPVCENKSEAEKYFVLLRQLFIDTKTIIGDNIDTDILSMGMSGDYELAIRHGSNLVRIGTAIFGERP